MVISPVILLSVLVIRFRFQLGLDMDGFEDSMYKAKAKAIDLWGQGQGHNFFVLEPSSRSRTVLEEPMPGIGDGLELWLGLVVAALELWLTIFKKS